MPVTIETDSKRVYIAGHRGLVGSALMRKFREAGFVNIVTRTRKQLDLTRQSAVERFFEKQRPQWVMLAAAYVGGIYANNSQRGQFIYNNLAIQTNVIEAARNSGVERLMFLGSSCVYPRDCPQPMREEYLLSGPLEQTNEPYAVAKIAGLKLCEAYNTQYGTSFFSVMPTNLYGPNDNFNLETAHVLPALIHKAHAAKVSNAPCVQVWGSGTPLREFLYVDDMAEACLNLMKHPDPPHLTNLGSGQEVSITQLAKLICDIVGYSGEIEYRTDRPDGTPRKLVDISRISEFGWSARTSLAEGIRRTYQWYRKH